MANTEGRVRHVVETYFERVNSRSFDELALLFADDAELVPPLSRPRRGRESIGAYYPSVLSGFATGIDTPTRIVVSGSTALVEIDFDGTLNTGQPITFRAIDVFEVEDGEIVRLSIWYDTHRLVRQQAQARAAAPPTDEERARFGSLAQATPARVVSALARVRQGTSFPLDGGRSAAGLSPHSAEVPSALVARAVIVDLVGHSEPLETCLERQRVGLRPGDVLLLRTASADTLALAPATVEWLRANELALIGTDAACIDAPGLDVAVRGHWQLDDLCAACAADCAWEGVLISLPREPSSTALASDPAVVLR
jgi:ketosteroid isomerase-like protein